MNIKPEDRRRFHRIDVDEEVNLEFTDEACDSCRIKNISLGGMFVAGYSARKQAESCRISLYRKAQSHQPRLQAAATVVWSNAEGVGLKFTSMNYDSYMVLLTTLINKAARPAVILREFPKNCPFEITSS